MRADQPFTRSPAGGLLCVLSLVFILGGAPASARVLEAARCSNVISDIDGAAASGWKAESAVLGDGVTLTHLHFVDERSGWAASERAVYRTSDGGRTWSAATLKVPTGFEVRQILFVNPSLGWVALVNFNGGFKGRQFWLMSTADGGETWRAQLKLKGAFSGGLSFVDGRTGWLVVNRFHPPVQFAPQVFRTEDGGKKWADVSGDLLQKLPANKQGVRPMMSDVAALSGSAARVGTTGGEVLSTSGGGRHWLVSEFPCTELTTPLLALSMGMRESGRLWMEHGADSLEGYWAEIFDQRDESSWIKYRLPSFALTAAVYASDSQVFAAGALIRYEPRFGKRPCFTHPTVGDAGRSSTATPV
jgi:hypothetical protein